MFFPSVAGDGDAGLLRLSIFSERVFGASRRHRIFPVSRSSDIVNNFSPSKAVRKIRSPTKIGDECPGGSATRQRIFLSRPNSTGSPCASFTPDPLGPRNRSQSLAKLVTAVRQASKTCKLMLINRDSYYTTDLGFARQLDPRSSPLAFQPRNRHALLARPRQDVRLRSAPRNPYLQ